MPVIPIHWPQIKNYKCCLKTASMLSRVCSLRSSNHKIISYSALERERARNLIAQVCRLTTFVSCTFQVLHQNVSSHLKRLQLRKVSCNIFFYRPVGQLKFLSHYGNFADVIFMFYLQLLTSPIFFFYFKICNIIAGRTF